VLSCSEGILLPAHSVPLPAREFKEVIKKVKQSRYTPWRRFGGEEYSSYSFSTSALDGGEWSASSPGRALAPGERTPGTHCSGGWVGPRAGLDTEDRGKILCPCRRSNPDRPVVQPVVRHYISRFDSRQRQEDFSSILCVQTSSGAHPAS
jgi:hypothetical protein